MPNNPEKRSDGSRMRRKRDEGAVIVGKYIVK